MSEIETVFKLAAVVLVAVAGRAAFLFFCPYRTCRWCRPGGLIGGSLPARIAGGEPRPRRPGRCWRCKGSRLTRRLGARHVHKVRLSFGQAWDERK